ncbi:TIGR00266 family protein [uncultured Ruminococcus sp.]|uniref:TIGR00266 family protein n=1 Tax=Ruminococcus sp. TaxID=41978 RepID=UPI0015B412D9|nr:TIGR00266 family protein [uncultured Ruminococcus sp.]
MKYEIKGSSVPALVCYLEKGESLVTERGAMSWMSPNLAMTTGGGVGNAFARLFQGESLFQNTYTAQHGRGVIALTSGFPGKIMAVDVTDNPIIAQKQSFLGCEPTVKMEMHFQKKIGAGFFGGEGFVMERFSGSGIVFLEFDGTVVTYNLKKGQSMIIDSGCLAAMEATCRIEAKRVKGVKRMLFSGEGLYHTKVTGPGKIWLQTMPADSMTSLAPVYFNIDPQ